MKPSAVDSPPQTRRTTELSTTNVMTLSRHQLEFIVGLFVLGGLIAVAYLAVVVGAGSFVSGSTYTVQARFTNTGGLNRGAIVSIAGVQVGRVESVDLDDAYRAIVTLRLRSSLQLPVDSTAAIRTSGLIGDKFISLSPGVEDELIAAGQMITNTESSVDLESLISRFAFGSVQNSGSQPAPAP